MAYKFGYIVGMLFHLSYTELLYISPNPGRVGSPKPLTFRRQRGTSGVGRGGGVGVGGASTSSCGGSGGSGGLPRSPRRVNPHAVTDDEGRPVAVLVDELNSVGFVEEMEPQQIFLPSGEESRVLKGCALLIYRYWC